MVHIVAGFATGLGLIVAIGAQNVHVLRHGLFRSSVGIVVMVCIASDAVLIVAGVAGLGSLVDAVPGLSAMARVGGAVFLLAYAGLALRRALSPAAGGLSAAGPPGQVPGAVITRTRAGSVVAVTLALTWLNPHVYLDTVFLLGSVAATHGDGRWLFAGGAILGSVVWFGALGYGARHLGRWLATPRAWRMLDGVIALVMAALAIRLLAF